MLASFNLKDIGRLFDADIRAVNKDMACVRAKESLQERDRDSIEDGRRRQQCELSVIIAPSAFILPRSVGGLRASLYNAMSVTEVESLTTFMADFMAANPLV